MPNSDISQTRPATAPDELTLLDTASPTRTIALVICIYCALWTMLTVLLSPVVPYDAVEAWHWGQCFEAGSPKNPWLVGGVAAVARLMPLSWPTLWYFYHFAALAIGAWGCWKLCERLIPDKRHALLGVMMMALTGTTSIDLLPYNDNYLLMMLWPWIWYGFIRAVYDNGRYWLFLGTIMALAGMAKYTTVLYLPFMLGILVWQGRLKTALKQPCLWAGIVVGCLLIAPNLYWLSQHDFAAFRWFSDRVGGKSAWAVVVVYSAVFYNVLLIIGLLSLAHWRWHCPTRPEVQAFIVLAVVPVVLLGVYFAVRGGVRTEWMMPFAVPLGLAAVMCMTPGVRGRYRLPLYTSYVVAVLAMLGFAASKTWEGLYSTRPREHVVALSVALDNWWQERYQRALVYAGGSRIGDWIGVYAPDHPQVPTRWPSEAVLATASGNHPAFPNIYTPGLTDAQLLQHGAMWVGEAGVLCSDPDVLELDPSLSASLRRQIEYHTLVFHQEMAPQAFFSICIGVLPPAQHGASGATAEHAHIGIVTEEE